MQVPVKEKKKKKKVKANFGIGGEGNGALKIFTEYCNWKQIFAANILRIVLCSLLRTV